MSEYSEGVAQIYVEETPSAEDAKQEYARLIDGNVAAGLFSGEVVHVVIDNGPPEGSLCIASTGCGPKSRANAARLALCWNEHDALVAQLERCREFIRNGVDLGYIRLPDPPDTGATRLSEIDALLARIKEEQS